MTEQKTPALAELKAALSNSIGDSDAVRPAVAAALACPACHARLRDLGCPACGYQLYRSNGVLKPGNGKSRNRFQTYSMDSNLAQYIGTALEENEYYLRFLPDTARLIVDCGGGAANASAPWARLHPEADLVVVDMDEFALEKSVHRNLPNLTPLMAPIASLPLADQAADVVFSTFVVEHVYDWELSDFYIEARRVLRPGGRLVIQSDAAFFDKYIHPVLRLLKRQGWRTSHFLERWNTGVQAVHHHNLKTAREQQAIIERHGFFVQGVEVPLLFSNRVAFAALYEAMAGVLPLSWMERFLGTSYTIVATTTERSSYR